MSKILSKKVKLKVYAFKISIIILNILFSLKFSVPGVCAHNYGEVRGKMTVPGSHVVSGPKCCNGNCGNPGLGSPSLQPLV